jgi:hypothetical protein
MWQKILSALSVIAIIIVAAVVGGIGKEVAKSVFAPSTPTPKQRENALTQGFSIAAQQINDRGPTMVDRDTRLDGASVGPGSRLTYHYTLVNHRSRDIDATRLTNILLPTVRQGVCNSKDMAKSLKYGATYVYSYSSSDGKRIAEFELRQSDCG